MSIRKFRSDLHVHTAVSPCGLSEMTPPRIVEAGKAAGLDVIAITDHNSVENAGAVMEAAEGSGLIVMPGLEVQSDDGSHHLCLFDTLDQALAMQEIVHANLPPERPPEDIVDRMSLVDAQGAFIRHCRKPIYMPTRLDYRQVYERVREIGGMMIPAHVNREVTGIYECLGRLPETPAVDAVEVFRDITPAEARAAYPELRDRAIFTNSDAHSPTAIGTRFTDLFVESPTVEEIRMACRGEGGRKMTPSEA